MTLLYSPYLLLTIFTVQEIAIMFTIELPDRLTVFRFFRVKGRPGRPKKVFIPMIPTEQLHLPLVVRSVKIPGRGRGRPPGSGRMAGKTVVKGDILVDCISELNTVLFLL